MPHPIPNDYASHHIGTKSESQIVDEINSSETKSIIVTAIFLGVMGVLAALVILGMLIK